MREAVDISVPKLRFPEFTGEWDLQKISSVAELTSGHHLLAYQYNHDGVGVPYFTGPSDFANQGGGKATPEGKVHAKLGHVIITVKGSGVGQLMINPFEAVSLGRQLMALYGKSLRNDLMYQLMLTRAKFLQALASGNMIPGLSRGDLLNLKFFLPHSIEQQKIAEFLTAVDEKIGKLKRKKELLEAYKKGAMQKLFSQEIRFKDDQGNPYPDWEEKRLGEIARLFNGYAFRSSEYHANGHYQIITISHVQDGLLKPNSCPRMSEVPIDLLPHQILKKGDILISMTGNVGRVCLVPDDGFLLNQRVGKLDLNIGDRTFIFQNLRRGQFKDKMKALAQGGAQDNLSSKSINKAKVPFPSLPEQQKIAEFLTGIDDKITAVANQIDKAAEFKKGLLQKMFVSSN